MLTLSLGRSSKHLYPSAVCGCVVRSAGSLRDDDCEGVAGQLRVARQRYAGLDWRVVSGKTTPNNPPTRLPLSLPRAIVFVGPSPQLRCRSRDGRTAHGRMADGLRRTVLLLNLSRTWRGDQSQTRASSRTMSSGKEGKQGAAGGGMEGTAVGLWGGSLRCPWPVHHVSKADFCDEDELQPQQD